jgi:aldehyde:ferredoxin oxidoreductase
MVKAATGWTDFAEEDLIKVGARTYALTRLFDIHTQQLTDPKEQWDKLVPERWFRDATPNGPLPGNKAFDGNKDKLFNEALPAYWKLRGWTEDKGLPTEQTLKDLGIDDIAGDILKQHM